MMGARRVAPATLVVVFAFVIATVAVMIAAGEAAVAAVVAAIVSLPQFARVRLAAVCRDRAVLVGGAVAADSCNGRGSGGVGGVGRVSGSCEGRTSVSDGVTGGYGRQGGSVFSHPRGGL